MGLFHRRITLSGRKSHEEKIIDLSMIVSQFNHRSFHLFQPIHLSLSLSFSLSLHTHTHIYIYIYIYIYIQRLIVLGFMAYQPL